MSLSLGRRVLLRASSYLASKGLQGLGELDRTSVGSQMLQGIMGPRSNPPARNTRDLLEMYRKQPWFRAVNAKIGFSVASIPWFLRFVEVDGRAIRMKSALVGDHATRDATLVKQQLQGATVNEVLQHPALDVIHDPNPVIRGIAMRKTAQIHVDIVGETFFLKERDPIGVVRHLWIIPPHWVRQTPTIGNPFFEVQWMQWHAFIPETEMVWCCDVNPERPYWRGTGYGEALSDDLETDEYSAKFIKSTFYNNAVPELLITMEGAKRGEVKRVEEDWRKQNQGIFRNLRAYFLNQKVQVDQIGMNFKNLQLVQLREFERNTIVQVYGVPPEILGILQQSNRATIEAAQFLFARWVLIPRLEMWRECYQKALIEESDERLILDYVSPLEEDFEKKLMAFKAAPHTVGMREWRALQGLPAEPEESDTFFIPQNLLPTTEPGTPVQAMGERRARLMEKEWTSMKALGLTDNDRPEKLQAA